MAARSGRRVLSIGRHFLFLCSKIPEWDKGVIQRLGRILMVEDDPKDVELTLTALEDYNLANEVVVVRDGEEALNYLNCQNEYSERLSGNPAVMLLDLKLPKVDGLEVLRQVKSNEALKLI